MRILSFLAVSLVWGCSSVDRGVSGRSPLIYDENPGVSRHELKKGKIQVGWTSDMVQVALGKPNRKYYRRTAQGEILVWAYTASITRPERQRVTGTFRFRDRDRRFQTATDTVFVTVDRHIEFDKLRVEFVRNVVTAIEEVMSKPVFF